MGYGPPGKLEIKGKNRTILLLFIVNKIPDVTLLLENNKIIHRIIIKGETLNWRERIKNKVEEYSYTVPLSRFDRVMSSQHHSDRVRQFIFKCNWSVRRDRMLLLWKLNIELEWLYHWFIMHNTIYQDRRSMRLLLSKKF